MRFTNYTWYKYRDNNELPWVRPQEIDKATLPRPIVLVNGAFDLLHSGHMKVIFAARERAATLVCAMDSDVRVRGAKGPARPVQSWIERATALAYMPIDVLVEIASEGDMQYLVNKLRPDLRVQGADYLHQRSRYPWLRKMFVRGTGMRTSLIVKRIEEAQSGADIIIG